MNKFLRYFLPIFIFFIFGLLLANFVIMPLIVRSGKLVTVPNVCNLPLERATDELKKVELEGIVTERRYDAIIEEGKVIIQSPLPDAKVKKGRIINLSVSLGPETVRVPYLAGVDIEKGKLILKRLGFSIESIDSIFSDSIVEKRIIRTIPESQTEVKKGDKIKLFVSKGVILRMPNLIGMPINKAKDIIEKMGLRIGEIKEAEGSGEKGSIIVQSPEPERVVERGDTISLMVIK